MTCKISELRKQLESMQNLLDTYEHFHVDSVTPEEKVKQACVDAIENKRHQYALAINRELIYKGFDIAIKAIQGVNN